MQLEEISCLTMVVLLFAAGGTSKADQQNIVHALFDHAGGKSGLQSALQIKCASGGDKIHLLDVYYKINICRAVEFRQNDAASVRNMRIVEQCTGKRVCLVREQEVSTPFLETKQGCLIGGGTPADDMFLLYNCVPQDKIKPICSTFEALSTDGYLSTSFYPLVMNVSEGKNPCVCDLRAVDGGGSHGSGRVHISFVELELTSEMSYLDPADCQTDSSRQYVQIQHSFGMSSSYDLCTHKYNYDVSPSQVFKVILSNPINRESGKMWMRYTVIGESRDVLVKVKCYNLHKYDPVASAAARAKQLQSHPIEHGETGLALDDNSTDDWKQGMGDLVLPLLSTLAVFLLITTGIVLLLIGLRYVRQRKMRRMRRADVRTPQALKEDAVLSEVVYVASSDKPTAYIPPTAAQCCRRTNEALDAEMDVKSFRTFDTLIYTKAKAPPSGGGSDVTPRFVGLPKMTSLESDNELTDNATPLFFGLPKMTSLESDNELIDNVELTGRCNQLHRTLPASSRQLQFLPRPASR